MSNTGKCCETGPAVFVLIRYPRRLESLTICRCDYKGSTFLSVLKDPECWSGLGLNLDLPLGIFWALPNELTRRRLINQDWIQSKNYGHNCLMSQECTEAVLNIICMSIRHESKEQHLSAHYNKKVGKHFSIPSVPSPFAPFSSPGWRVCPHLCWDNLHEYPNFPSLICLKEINGHYCGQIQPKPEL